MSTLLKTLVMGLAFISTASMAQLSQFTGWEAGANVNFNDAKSESGSTSTSDKNTGVSLHGGYGMAINNDYAILLGLDMALDKIKSGEGDKASLYFKSPYSLTVAPAMLLNDNTLLYVKVSYESAKFNFSTTTKDINGYGLGVGARYILSKGIYLQAELKGITYNQFQLNGYDVNSSNSQINIGAGFNF